VVVGPIADAVAEEMRAVLRSPGLEPRPRAAAEASPVDAALAAALGGPGNLAASTRKAGRLCITLHRPDPVDDAALRRAAPRGFVWTAPDRIQVLAGE
jgi:phosphotransferase system IIB component